MRFLLDQSTDARLVGYLRSRGHRAGRMGAEYPGGISDEQVLVLAEAEGAILLTDDRDFGDLVFRHRQPHAGVIFFRLPHVTDLAGKTAALDRVLSQCADELDQFIVVTESDVRVRSSS